MVSKKSQDSELLDSGRPEWTFDPELQRELDRGEFAGEEKTIEGEIAGTGEWTSGKPIPLRIAIPHIVDDSTGENNVFTEKMDVPKADEPLSTTKFGRILKAHGYSRGSAHHLTGDKIKCSYDGEWTTVDPNPRSQDEPSTTNSTSRTANTTKYTNSSSTRHSSKSNTHIQAKKHITQGIFIVFSAMVLRGVMHLTISQPSTRTPFFEFPYTLIKTSISIIFAMSILIILVSALVLVIEKKSDPK